MDSELKLLASIVPNDRDAQDRRHAKIHFNIETGDLKKYANMGNIPSELTRTGVDIYFELDFSASGYNAKFIESHNDPEPLHKEITVASSPTNSHDFDYTLIAGYNSFKDRKIIDGLVHAVKFQVRIDNIWADVKHGTLAMPAYMIMLKFTDLRINGRSYFGNCKTNIIAHYSGINYQIEWIDSTNPSSVKTWSSRYAVVETIGFIDIFIQFSPSYRVDDIIALVFELVIGGIFGVLIALLSTAPGILIHSLPFLVGLSILLLSTAGYISISLGRYRLKPRTLNLEQAHE